MTRDWNLIRKLLLRMEQEPSAKFDLRADDWPSYDAEVIDYHLNLMIEAKLIDGQCVVTKSQIRSCRAHAITWKGHELLDKIRKDNIWAKIKQSALDKGIDLSFDLIPTLFTSVIQ